MTVLKSFLNSEIIKVRIIDESATDTVKTFTMPQTGILVRFAQVLCLAGALASTLAADTIVYDNTAEGSAGADGVGFAGPLFDSFTSGAAGQITDLQLALLGDDTSSGTVEAGLYADNSTSPGQLIAILGSISDSELSGTAAIYDIALTSSPLLTSNTQYWIGLSGTTAAEWSYDSDGSGIGVADDYFANQVGVFSNDNAPYQMSITEADVSETPEPSTRSSIIIGIGILALLGRNRLTAVPKL